MSGIEDILSQINYLPPFPLTVTRVLQMLRDPYVKTDDLVGVVKFDQAIATHVLKLCNSSFFGLRRPITNLRDAVVYIGLSNLKKIIIISGTRQYFEKQQSAYELKKGELWRHAIAVSILAEKLNNMIDGAPIDDVYISGLLHDVGKLVLSKFVMEVSEEITHMVEQRGISFLEAEKTILGIDHAEVGAKILDKWKFSEEIIASVKKHHMPLDEDDSVLVNIVRLSNSLAMIMGYATSINGYSYPGLPDTCCKYGITQESLENIMAVSLEEIKTVESDFGLPAET